MKKCPYCFAEIDSQALKCRHCGEWVERPSQQKSNNPDNDTPAGWAKSFMKSDDLNQTLNEGVKLYAGWKVISAIIGAIIFLLFFLGVFLPQFNRVNHDVDSFNHSGMPKEVRHLLQEKGFNP
jgi:uncharacterized membrane protein YvbJ